MKKYNLSHIMTRAWEIFRQFAAKKAITFGEALHRAWQSCKSKDENNNRIEAAKAEAGITEETHTHSEWKDLGYTVIHGSKALFKAVLIWASHGDGKTYTASFFGASQVEASPAC